MKFTLKTVAWLLLAAMLLTSLAACTNPSEDSTAGDLEETTEAVSGPDSTGSTEQPSEAESESETESATASTYDTTPLTLESPKDLYPEYEVYENVSTENLTPPDYVPFEQKYEAENYDNTTITFWNVAKSDEHSGGSLIQAITYGGAPKDGWDYVYSVSYKVTVPTTGSYNITALTSALGQDYTSDYYVDVNGTRQLNVNKATATQLEDINYSLDKGLFYVYDLGNLSLNEGENTVSFVVNNEDSQASWNRVSFFFDYFTLEAVKPDDLKPEAVAEISYDVDVSKVEDGKVIAGAAEVNVFDCRFPVKLSFSHYFKEAGKQSYTVTNFFGDVVYEGTLEGALYDLAKVERGIKNHPTGFFTFACGEQTFNYVVTPSYELRTLESSPFAMDYAAQYHNNNLTNCYNVTAAARLAGVTWVRERAGWNSYEPTKGNYKFTSTENLFKTIDSTGMNLLVDLCPAPTWATSTTGYTGKNRAGGFQHNQLAFYNMCKAMVEYYDGVVDAWELWNESDHGFAVETAELFAAWYKAGALGVIDADADMIVSFGGFCQPNTNSDYVHLTMLNDILKYSSIYNYHSHIAQPSTYSFVDFNKTAMQRYAYPTASLYNTLNRPIWITEAGMRIDNMVYKSYIEQASYIVTSTVQSLSAGTDMHYWFLLSPYMESGGDFGTFAPDLTPYPTLAAGATMTEVLGEAKYLGELLDLPNKAYGYLFNTGSRMASVIWTQKGETEYTFEANAPVIVTDLMGGKTLVEPTDGKITVAIGTYPIFITYSTPLEAYYKQVFDDSKLENLTFTLGDRVVLSPEFENYDINDANIKKNGHEISDGLKIKVRVTNYNSVAVTGKVNATLMGFEVQGCDTEITVEPFSEGFITLTLKKTGSEGINSYITFVGTFNGEETSKASAHVYTKGTADTGSLIFAGVKDGTSLRAGKLGNIRVIAQDGADGVPTVLLNEQPIDTFTYENGEFKLDLSWIEVGKYVLIVALEADGGDYIFTHVTFHYDGEEVIFHMP
ncbi:MAG: hypothetical protein IJY39_07830 [Clostridia bacterium]|nr:hypothetical protein [Clostridia bacterium]